MKKRYYSEFIDVEVEHHDCSISKAAALQECSSKRHVIVLQSV
jgi:hypothetical protein